MKEHTLETLNRLLVDLRLVSRDISQQTGEVTASGDHIAIIKHFNHCRLAAEAIKDARKSLEEMSDNMSRVVIPDVVASLKERTGEKPPFNIEGVGRVTVSYKYSCSMTDKEQALRWLKDNDYGGIVQETVANPTLCAFAKDLMENKGFELPVEFFKTGTVPYTSIRAK